MAKERELIQAACARMDVVTTDTCINYQTRLPAAPRRARRLGRHRHRDLRQLGVRRALELRVRAGGAGGGDHRPHARVRLSSRRAPPRHASSSSSNAKLDDLADWGAVGKLVGETHQDYFAVPVFHGYHRTPTADELKHSAPRSRATARWACSTSSASRPRRRRSKLRSAEPRRRGAHRDFRSRNRARLCRATAWATATRAWWCSPGRSNRCSR